MTTGKRSGIAPKRPPRDRALNLWIVLSRAFAAIEEHAREQAAGHGLTLAEFGVLEALHHQGPMLQGEIQRKLLVSSGGITYLVDRLVHKGLVERQACASDRRASYAGLTAKGSALIADIFPEHAAALRQAMSGLSATEQEQAAALLKKLGLAAAAGSGGKDGEPSAA